MFKVYETWQKIICIAIIFLFTANGDSSEENDVINLNIESNAKLLNLPEALGVCSGRSADLAFTYEKISPEQGHFAQIYVQLQEAADTRSWMAIHLISGVLAYSYIDIGGKSTSTSIYASNRQDAINRAKNKTYTLDITQKIKYNCIEKDLSCSFAMQNPTKWRSFENKCVAAPLLSKSNNAITCHNASAKLLEVKYDSYDNKRLYGFLAGWYNARRYP